jgi:DNA processing protein
MTTVCDACLKRGALVAMLAEPIATALRPDDRRRPGVVLALGNDELIAAVAGDARPRIERAIRRFRPAVARARLAAADCDAVCRHAEAYPERLTQLVDAPNPLYMRGGVERFKRLTSEPAVAMVGARHPSEYAREVAQEMGRGLAAAGVTVISGLALGIDAVSHRGALAAAGAGVLAVLACGPDLPYPRRHRRLYEEIVGRGVVLSELEPGTQPFQWSFPARNRIMAALAEVVVVVEAREASGSLITSGFAEDLGRGVLAVPGQVTSRVAAGSNQLLYHGAGLARNAEDVLDVLFGVGAGPRESRAPEPELETPLRIVLDAVEVRDSLERAGMRAGLSAGGLRAALGRLEALGLVRRDGVGGYERRAGSGRAT